MDKTMYNLQIHKLLIVVGVSLGCTLALSEKLPLLLVRGIDG